MGFEPIDAAKILNKKIQPDVIGLNALHKDLLKEAHGYRNQWESWYGKTWGKGKPATSFWDPKTGERVGKSYEFSDKKWVEYEYKYSKDEIAQEKFGLYDDAMGEGKIRKFDDLSRAQKKEVITEYEKQLHGTVTEKEINWAKKNWKKSGYQEIEEVDSFGNTVKKVSFMREQPKVKYQVKRPEVTPMFFTDAEYEGFLRYLTRQNIVGGRPEGVMRVQGVHDDIVDELNVLMKQQTDNLDMQSIATSDVTTATMWARAQANFDFEFRNVLSGGMHNFLVKRFRRSTKDTDDLHRARIMKDQSDKRLTGLTDDVSVSRKEIERLQVAQDDLMDRVAYVKVDRATGKWNVANQDSLGTKSVAPQEFIGSYVRQGKQGEGVDPAGMVRMDKDGNLIYKVEKKTERDYTKNEVIDGEYRPYTLVEKEVKNPKFEDYHNIGKQIKDEQAKLSKLEEAQTKARSEGNTAQSQINFIMQQKRGESDPLQFIEQATRILDKLKTKKTVFKYEIKTPAKYDKTTGIGSKETSWKTITEDEWDSLTKTQQQAPLGRKTAMEVDASVSAEARRSIEQEYLNLLDLQSVQLFSQLGKVVKASEKLSPSMKAYEGMPALEGIDKHGFLAVAYQLASETKYVGKSRMPMKTPEELKNLIVGKDDWEEAVTKLFPSEGDKSALMAISLSQLASFRGKVKLQDILTRHTETQITGLKEQVIVAKSLWGKQPFAKTRWSLEKQLETKENFLAQLKERTKSYKEEINTLETNIQKVQHWVPDGTFNERAQVEQAVSAKHVLDQADKAVATTQAKIDTAMAKKADLEVELALFSEKHQVKLPSGEFVEEIVEPIKGGLQSGRGDVTFVMTTRIETPQQFFGAKYPENLAYWSDTSGKAKVPYTTSGRESMANVFYVSTGDVPAFSRIEQTSFIGKLFERVFRQPISDIAPTGFGKTGKRRYDFVVQKDKDTGMPLRDEKGHVLQKKVLVDENGREISKYEMDLEYMTARYYPSDAEITSIAKALVTSTTKRDFWLRTWKDIKKGLTKEQRYKILKDRPKAMYGFKEGEELSMDLYEAGAKNITYQHVDELQKKIALEMNVPTFKLSDHADRILDEIQRQKGSVWETQDLIRYQNVLRGKVNSSMSFRQKISAKIRERKQFKDSLIFAEKARQTLYSIRHKIDPETQRIFGGDEGGSFDNFVKLYNMDHQIAQRRTKLNTAQSDVTKANFTLGKLRSTDYVTDAKGNTVNRIATESDVKSGKIVGWDTMDDSYKDSIKKAFEVKREAEQTVKETKPDVDNYILQRKELETKVNTQRLFHSTQLEDFLIKFYRTSEGAKEAKTLFLQQMSKGTKYEGANSAFWDDLEKAIDASGDARDTGRLKTFLKDRIEEEDLKEMSPQAKQLHLSRKFSESYLSAYGYVPPNFAMYYQTLRYPFGAPPWTRAWEGQKTEQTWIPEASGQQQEGLGGEGVPKDGEGAGTISTGEGVTVQGEPAGLDVSIIPKDIQDALSKQFDMTMPALRVDSGLGLGQYAGVTPIISESFKQIQDTVPRETPKLTPALTPVTTSAFEPVFTPIRRSPFFLFPPIFPMFPDYRRRPRRTRAVKRPKRKIWWDVPEQPLGEPWAATEYRVFGTAGQAGEPEYIQRKERKKKLDATPFGIPIDQDVNFWTQHPQDRSGFTMRRPVAKDSQGRTVKDKKGKKVRYKGQKEPWKRQRGWTMPDSE